jgi:hypothetical protein
MPCGLQVQHGSRVFAQTLRFFILQTSVPSHDFPTDCCGDARAKHALACSGMRCRRGSGALTVLLGRLRIDDADARDANGPLRNWFQAHAAQDAFARQLRRCGAGKASAIRCYFDSNFLRFFLALSGSAA